MHTDQNDPSRRLTYKELDAWKRARDLAVLVLRVTNQEPLRRHWGLCDQMQRAAISIPSNIAEGDERGTNADALRFLYISKGSLAELRTQADIAHVADKIPDSDFGELESAAEHVGRLLGGMIRRRLKRREAE